MIPSLFSLIIDIAGFCMATALLLFQLSIRHRLKTNKPLPKMYQIPEGREALKKLSSWPRIVFTGLLIILFVTSLIRRRHYSIAMHTAFSSWMIIFLVVLAVAIGYQQYRKYRR